MKKTIALILSLIMALSFAACSNTQQPAEEPSEEPAEQPVINEPENTVGLPNPITEYDSIEKLNEASGVIFAKPPVMGVSDEYYQSIAGDPVIYEYGFKVNGVQFDVRFCEDFEPDISGVYEDGKTAFEGENPGDSVKYYDDCKLYRFCNIYGQYVIMAFDGGTYEEQQFVDICEEIKSLMVMEDTGDPLTNFPGEYADEVSQRATLSIERLSEEEMLFTVSWSDSADSTTTWTMTVTMDDEARLVYSDCKCVTKGTEETTLYENGTGYFDFDAEKIFWTGAADENCKTCQFVKVE